MTTNVSFLAAFVAGIFSIASPCVLPLVPIYLAHITGVAIGDSETSSRRTMLANALAYVLGFSVVFVALGAALGAAGAFAGGLDAFNSNRYLLTRSGGALVVLLGLHQIGIIRLPFLERTRAIDLKTTRPGELGSSFLVGVTFGAGWSPCVGPILGAILTLAAGQGSVERATLLLVVYSLGLGIPFIIVALAFGSAPGVLRRLNGRLRAVTTVSGAIMLAVGIIMMLGIYERLFTEIIRVAPWTPWEPML
ncbi:MAG: cytochrome c biogenesis protein CcdA [Thermomicrobiales bacterium]